MRHSPQFLLLALIAIAAALVCEAVSLPRSIAARDGFKHAGQTLVTTLFPRGSKKTKGSSKKASKGAGRKSIKGGGKKSSKGKKKASSSVNGSSKAKGQRRPRPKAGAAPESASDAFCMQFVKSCYDEAAAEKPSGHVTVVFACARNGNKYSSSYHFGCKIEGQDRTNAALDRVGGYRATTTQGSTVIVTQTETDRVTQLSSVTKSVDTTVGSTVPQTDVTTKTVPATASSLTKTTTTTTGTTTSTTLITTTATIESLSVSTTTSTSTFVTTIPVVSTSVSTILTTTTVATTTVLGAVPMVVVAPGPAGGSAGLRRDVAKYGSAEEEVLLKRSTTSVDLSQFCSAFAQGCSKQCSRVHSSPKYEYCSRIATMQYRVACVCANKKVETQHALKAAADDQRIETISTLYTSTQYVTDTVTTTVPTTLYTTATHTSYSTQHIPTTATLTSTSTSTATSTSTLTVESTVPATSTTTTTTTTPRVTATTSTTTTSDTVMTPTTTTTTTTSVISTTQVVALPTGIIQVTRKDNAAFVGYVGPGEAIEGTDAYVSNVASAADAVHFVPVIDQQSTSGLFKLIVNDGSGNALTSSAEFDLGDGDLDSSASNYLHLLYADPSQCGSSATQPGPDAGNDDCEVYIFDASHAPQLGAVQTRSDGTHEVVNFGNYDAGNQFYEVCKDCDATAVPDYASPQQEYNVIFTFEAA